ncbi:MAG TPA: HD domain-containing phosphohydrolase [Longimicrobiaceae bacterium]|nr:HD domain-containing phosphohydrolase [Longimicrobiaceae bacterium]
MPASNSPAAAPVDRILVVDDEPNICRLLQRYLGRLGYEVETAGSVPDALQILQHARFDLVLTDLRLPGPSGLDLLVEVRSRCPGTRTILMSAHADVYAAAAAIERGVDQLVVKPFELEDLRARVSDSLAKRRAEREAEAEREQLETKLRQRDTESKIWILRAAHALATAVEAKDEYTAGHAARVTTYALTIAERIGGIDPVRFRLAGDLHDVGKIGVPDSVLNKPGQLTSEEFDLIKKHPGTGAHILEPLIDDPLVLGVVRWHHERWDGRGYPDRLEGEAIPLPARVLAVADTLDAMTSHRAYRQGLGWEAVVEEIRRCTGTQFDPGVVVAFESALPALEQQYHGFVEAFAKARPTAPSLVK